jgi:hypothetical protein
MVNGERGKFHFHNLSYDEQILIEISPATRTETSADEYEGGAKHDKQK